LVIDVSCVPKAGALSIENRNPLAEWAHLGSLL
jgi:hypothetical protein